MAGKPRVRACAAIAVLTIAGAACSNDREPVPPVPSAEAPAVTKPACEVATPTPWYRAIDDAAVPTGGVSTVPLTVSRDGEVVAVRDNGDTRDLLLIKPDESVTKIYDVPGPNLDDVGFAALNDDVVVVGVDRIPRSANGVLPALVRVDVVDRHGGGVGAVTDQSASDYAAGRNALDSVALFDGKVYWIRHDNFSGETGVVRSFDPATGDSADVATGIVDSLRTTAGGLAWIGDRQVPEVEIPATLPAAVADAPAVDRVTLASDGTAYAWLEQGGAGVGWWSPSGGMVRVTGEFSRTAESPAVYVVGPLVVIAAGVAEGEASTVVDTRSGAVTHLRDAVAGADGGTIALVRATSKLASGVGLLRTDALSSLTC